MESELQRYDYEAIYKIEGFESALLFLIEKATGELVAGVDPGICIVRFHVKASKLRRLVETDNRMHPPRRRKCAP